MVNHPLPAPMSATTDAECVHDQIGPLPLVAIRRFEQAEIRRRKQSTMLTTRRLLA
jgi:hypothetical protein